MKSSKYVGVANLAWARLVLTGVAGALLLAGVARGQTVIGEDGLNYTVQPGDTLYNISEEYLQDPKHWPGLAQDAHVAEPRRLQPGQVIHLPMDYLRHEKKEVLVVFQRGETSVVQGDSSKPLTRGMVLTEGQTIKTGANGFVSLELPDGSRLFLSADSQLRISQFRHVPEVNKDLVEFVLESGYVESSVAPQPNSSRFRVSTPLAVTGVRGTRFGVALSPDGQQQANDVTHGTVGITPTGSQQRSGAAPEVRINVGQGAVMSANALSPEVVNLLPAPELNGWPKYVHENVWMPPEVMVAQASGYAVRVAPEGAPDQIIFESRGELQPIPLPDEGHYQIQVRALDAYAVPGSVANHQIQVKTLPLPPLLQTPRDKAFVALGDQQLLCTNSPGIKRYMLQVASDKAFTQIADQQVNADGCQFTFKPATTGTYYWRTASLDEAAQDIDAARGEFSTIGQFDVVLKPQAPQAGEAMGDKGIVLHWAEVAPGVTYLVQLSEQIDFSKIAFSEETMQTQIDLGFSHSCNTMYVRLQSTASNGVASAFSPPRVLQAAQTWCSDEGSTIVDGQGVPIKMGDH